MVGKTNHFSTCSSLPLTLFSSQSGIVSALPREQLSLKLYSIQSDIFAVNRMSDCPRQLVLDVC